jgi:hypothetical protein
MDDKNTYNLEDIQEFFDNEDLQLADAQLLAISIMFNSYLKFAEATIQTKEEIFLKRRGITNPLLIPAEVAYESQKLALIAICIFATIAIERFKEIELENYLGLNPKDLTPYKQIVDGYILSVYANIMRTNALSEIVAQSEQTKPLI